MAPKVKAKDLIHKHLNYFGTNKDAVEREKAKQSAIITVDEILQDFASYRVKGYLTLKQAKELSLYWAEVKEILETSEI